jgi:hypothetical protein
MRKMVDVSMNYVNEEADSRDENYEEDPAQLGLHVFI